MFKYRQPPVSPCFGHDLLFVAGPDLAQRADIADTLAVAPDSDRTRLVDLKQAIDEIDQARAVVLIHPAPAMLEQLAQVVSQARCRRDDGFPVLVAGLAPQTLTAAGQWLAGAAAADTLNGVRLIVDDDPAVIIEQASARAEAFHGPTTVAMPVSTEVETPRYKYFYCISPELRHLLRQLAELADNQIERIYLLGGPGTGKTTLAYFYYLARARGNFVTVNLTAEATGDKTAMKSLLCGHVAGAFANAGNRTGAFTHARDGVCFLDESHGVSGDVMDVLIEALDSGQYLPFGASAKRPLDCGVVFASNRTWEQLVQQVNLDEHARLAAVILNLADLAARPEDLIAVAADTLARMAAKSTSWQAPTGCTPEAWRLIRDAPWHGNTRALMRVLETAFVNTAIQGQALIQAATITHALLLWDPKEHASQTLYTRSRRSGLSASTLAF